MVRGHLGPRGCNTLGRGVGVLCECLELAAQSFLSRNPQTISGVRVSTSLRGDWKTLLRGVREGKQTAYEGWNSWTGDIAVHWKGAEGEGKSI